MPLDLGLVTALLIEYDSEHPKTLGEMADRRAIYARRLAALSANADIIVQKFTNRIGDGIGNQYVLPNPFHNTDIVVTHFLVETGEELMNAPDIGKDYIRFYYDRAIRPGEIDVVIFG